MQKMILVTIRDLKAETYTPPHATNNSASALREFETLVCDPKKSSLIATHPADFELWYVADWKVGDNGEMGVDPLSAPVRLASGSDYVSDGKAVIV